MAPRLVSLSGITLAAMLAATPLAQAADYLRGAYAGHAEPKSAGVDWSGFYGGVHAGASVGEIDSSAFAKPLAQRALPSAGITQDLLLNTIAFRRTNQATTSYGAFAGMNWVWDDVVLGFEGDYTRSNIRGKSAFGPYGLMRVDGTNEWGVNSTSEARARISDWATFRGRVGWAAGMFMPFLTAGLALGNVDGRATTSGTWDRIDISTPPARPVIGAGAFSAVVGRRGIAYGGVVGAGIDMQLLPNTFVRAEWQHIQFASGADRPDISLNTARVAGGVKF